MGLKWNGCQKKKGGKKMVKIRPKWDWNSETLIAKYYVYAS